MTPELANCVLEGLLLLHEELWILAGELYPRSSAALVDAWYRVGRSALLPVNCTGGLFSSRHLQLVG